jgi:cleavage and polyadenylation specificity factor subunit 4
MLTVRPIADECLYLHIDPNSRLPPCPWYERGFCPLGPHCSKKHVRKTLCEFYLAGFCPDGPQCKKAHPQYPTDLAKPTVRVEKTAEQIEEEQRVLRENAEREEEKEREKYGGGGEGGERGRGRGGRWFGSRGRGGQDGQRRQRARGHY